MYVENILQPSNVRCAGKTVKFLENTCHIGYLSATAVAKWRYIKMHLYLLPLPSTSARCAATDGVVSLLFLIMQTAFDRVR